MGVPTVVSLALVACILICDYTSVVSANSLADIAAKIKRRTFENFDMAREKRKMCSDSNESCGMPWVCCDDLICQRDSYFKSGRCVVCVGENGPCTSDSDCCPLRNHEDPTVQCDKEGFLRVHGKCKPPRDNGEECFDVIGSTDSQCKSGYCYTVGVSTPGSGRCVTCVGQTGPCVSDDECCGHESRSAQCDKSRLGKVFGKCLPPRENGETCFETALGGIDTQCKSGYCDMDWSKSSGVCKNINVA